jgi:hypothetical protein
VSTITTGGGLVEERIDDDDDMDEETEVIEGRVKGLGFAAPAAFVGVGATGFWADY